MTKLKGKGQSNGEDGKNLTQRTSLNKPWFIKYKLLDGIFIKEYIVQ